MLTILFGSTEKGSVMPANCSRCGNPANADGSCPICMLGLGISASQIPASIEKQGLSMPTIEELRGNFPQLEILRMIGRGGMGAIYLARQTNLDRFVALKLIAKEIADDAAFVERFEREAKALAKLSHPNIVTVFDFGRTADGMAYLMMEYVDGVNLREALSSKSIDSEDALEIVATMCRALEYAHAKGVVHRDIKPENILLGEDGSLKVADFGIAKIVDDSVRSVTLTGTKQVLGSLHYLAPEQLEAPDQVDHRVDLYALGVIFYELLTGQLPLGRFEVPSAMQSQVDPRVDAIVLKTLQRKPSLRYQSAFELESDINQVKTSPVAGPLLLPIEEENATSQSVPFECETMGGFASAIGILHATKNGICIEYRTSDQILGILKSELNIIDIPSHGIAKMSLKQGVFNSKLVIVPKSLSLIGSFPNSSSGTIELKIKRADRGLAERVCQIQGYPYTSELVHESQGTHNATVAVFMILFGIMNIGFIVTMVYTAMEAVRLDERIPIMIGAPLIVGPIAVLQIVSGILFGFAGFRSLAKAALAAGMLPVTPTWMFSLPIGIWASRYLNQTNPTETASHPNRSAPATPVTPAKPIPAAKSWGATTLMFLRENRNARILSVFQGIAIVIGLTGVGIYYAGFYPTQQRFRIVVSEYDPAKLESALHGRLSDMSYRMSIAENRLVIKTWKNQRSVLLQRLKHNAFPKLVWLSKANASVQAPGTESANLPSKPIAVAPGLDIAELQAIRSPLGMQVVSIGPEMEIPDASVSKLEIVSGTDKQQNSHPHRIRLDLTSAAKETLQKSHPGVEVGGLGLLVDGLLEGIAIGDAITNRSIEFQLSSTSSATTESVFAAIRGPELPCPLEVLR